MDERKNFSRPVTFNYSIFETGEQVLILAPEQEDLWGKFLSALRYRFGFTTIYYPGCGTDTKLEEAFIPENIFYLDRYSRSDDWDDFTLYDLAIGNRSRNCVVADFSQAPFRDNAFGAIFFEDNHADMEDLPEILRTLKPGGIIIVGSNCPGPDRVTRDTFETLPGFKKITDLQLEHPLYEVFQKT